MTDYLDDLSEAMKQRLEDIAATLWSNPEEGAKFVADPDAYLTREGVEQTAKFEDIDLGDVVSNVAPVVDLSDNNTTYLVEAAHSPSPSAYAAAASSAKSGPAAAPAAPAAAPAAAAAAASSSSSSGGGVTYDQIKELFGEGIVTQVHETNNNYDYSVDNSTEFTFKDIEAEDGDVNIDLHNEVTNATAQGDGAVAAGDDAKGVATGDNAIAVGDDVDHSQLNTGDGAVQADGDIKAPVNTGEMDQSILADGDVYDTQIGDGGNIQDLTDSQAATGDNNTMVDSDGGDIGAVGDGNAVIQNSDHVNAGFGEGNVTEIDDSTIDDSALAFGDGDAAAVDTDTTIDNSVDDSFNTDQQDNSTTNQSTAQTTTQDDNSDNSIDDVGNVDADQSFNEIDSNIEDVEVHDDLEIVED